MLNCAKSFDRRKFTKCLSLIADSDEVVLCTYYEIGISLAEAMLYAVCRETAIRLLSTDVLLCDLKLSWVFVACLGMEEDRGGSNRKSMNAWGSVVY